MTKHRRTALAAAPLSLALLLAACSDDDSADPTPTTTTTEATSTSSSEPPSETTAPPSSETTGPEPEGEDPGAPPETASEAGAPLPEAGAPWASELVRAWGVGDRDRAGELATPEVVEQLFAHAESGGDDWALVSCDSTAAELYCTFVSAERGESLTTQQASDPVATITFGTTAGVTPPLADAADALIRAWGAGDRDAAARYASATDVQTLFGDADPGGDAWERAECLSIDGDDQCVYRSPDRDETVIVHLSEGTDLPVTGVLIYHPS